MAITTGVGEWVIAAKMRGLRAAMQPSIDQIPAADPSRVAFAALHGYSVLRFNSYYCRPDWFLCYGQSGEITRCRFALHNR